jgi:DNA-binding SARP family transcriptional activator
VDFRVLGEVEAVDDAGEVVALTPALKAILAVLLTEVNRSVRKERFVTSLRETSLASNTIDRYVGDLRSLLRARFGGRAQLLSTGDGHLQLVIDDPGTVDLDRFRRHQVNANTADDSAAAAALGEAIAEFRGTPLEGLDGPLVDNIRTNLDEQYRKVCYERARLMMGLGLHAEVLDELITYRQRWSGDERLFALMVDALVANGRRAEVQLAFDRFDTAHHATEKLDAYVRRVLDRKPNPLFPRGDASQADDSALATVQNEFTNRKVPDYSTGDASLAIDSKLLPNPTSIHVDETANEPDGTIHNKVPKAKDRRTIALLASLIVAAVVVIILQHWANVGATDSSYPSTTTGPPVNPQLEQPDSTSTSGPPVRPINEPSELVAQDQVLSKLGHEVISAQLENLDQGLSPYPNAFLDRACYYQLANGGGLLKIHLIELADPNSAKTVFDSLLSHASASNATKPQPLLNAGEEAFQSPGFLIARKEGRILAISITSTYNDRPPVSLTDLGYEAIRLAW